MSIEAIREAAEREVEPDETDAEEEQEEEQSDAEPEPELEPEQSAPEPAPAGDAEATIRALESEDRRHLKVLVKHLGEDMAEHACEACAGFGYVPVWLREVEALQPHDDFRACDTCKGWGQVLTGSKRAGNEARDCPDCGGSGFKAKVTGVAPASDGAQLVGVDSDGYGRPSWMGDPAVSRIG